MSRPADPSVRGGALAVAAGALGLAVILAVPAAAATPSESWSAEIALEGGDDRGVVLTDGAVRLDGVPNGEVVLAPRRTLGLVDGIAGVPAADVPRGAAVVVEARGLQRDGRWGDWVRVPREGAADLGDPTGEIGIRILLRRADSGESPVLRGLWLATTAAAPPTSVTTRTSTVTVSPSTRPTTTTAPTTTTTTTTRPTTTTTEPTTTTTRPTTTTTRPTTTRPTTTRPTTTTTSATRPSTTTTAPPSSTTTRPTTTRPTTTPPSSTSATSTTTSEPEATTEPEPTTTTPTSTTTTTTTTPPVIPPPGLVPPGFVPPGLVPPGLPTTLPVPVPVAASDAGETSSWWGSDLMGWLARAF
jgi:hypothetical protein